MHRRIWAAFGCGGMFNDRLLQTYRPTTEQATSVREFCK